MPWSSAAGSLPGTARRQRCVRSKQPTGKTYMKKTPLIHITVVVLLLTAALFGAEPSAKDAGHLGTWRLISTKYGDAKEFSDVSKDEPHIKIITPTHFIWVI